MSLSALIFASGKGKRLKPLTDKTYKGLLPVVNDRSLIEYWVNLFGECEEVNTIYISMCMWEKEIKECVNSNITKHMLEKVRFIVDNDGDDMFSTGGATFHVSKYLSEGEKLIIVNSDTYIPEKEVNKFIVSNPVVWEQWPIMLGVTYSQDTRDQSYILFDTNNNIIHQFKEKQSKVKEGHFWSGIAMLHKSIIDKSFNKVELSRGVFGSEKFAGRMKAYPIECALDIGKDLETYRRIYEKLTIKPRDHIERLNINEHRPGSGSTMFGGVRGDHIARYLFASKHVIDKKVLDIGCGTGYGLKIMSYMASEITGIDISEEARKAFWELDCSQPQCPITFVVRDLNNPMWIPKEGGYDVITAFEIIEHFKNPEHIIHVAHDYLKAGGLFICSVPDETHPSMGMSIYHNHLFTLKQFRELLQKEFKPGNITVYGQKQTYFSTVDVDNAGYFVAIVRKD